ncbi:hypothetical protein PHLGIDRAFT_130649 [Phlebiopsis gigantea 11061_1 CR5-6]|uniref:DNA polymerase epsilon subunit D n=1 Tax=Phlebiopsis gigantea (strain 11061_1 CR5-6) TaxID=745531 RepID=A0A0C3PC38_PHLG1|nr:hypothetical protein PHLGIDRAFT_130649 [Phlebiopsis gigantea 11061_1 CR5-6]
MPRKESNTGSSTAQAQQDAVSDGIDAYELPKSLVTRLARSALPDNAKLQKESVLALMKGSTVFINYLAATAHDVASQKQHKSVSASDVLKALELLELGDMLPKLQTELQAYRDHQKGDKGRRGGARAKAKDAAESVSAKGKGKAKASTSTTITIPGRAASRPAPFEVEDEPMADGHASVQKAYGSHEHVSVQKADESDEGEDAEIPDREGEVELEDAPYPEDDDELDEGEDEGDEGDEDDEGDEPEDEAGLEDEELRADARGVDDHEGVMDED